MAIEVKIWKQKPSFQLGSSVVVGRSFIDDDEAQGL